MDALAEGDMPVRVVAGDVERLRVGEARRIAVGRGQDDQQRIALGDRLPAQLDVLPGEARGRGLGRTVVAQDLLDGVRDETWIGAQLVPPAPDGSAARRRRWR